MRESLEYPLSAFKEATESVVGWSLAMAGATFLGHWIGLWITIGSPPGPTATVQRMAISFLFFIYPPFTIVAILVTLFSWWVPLLSEESWPRVAGVLATVLVWIVAMACGTP